MKTSLRRLAAVTTVGCVSLFTLMSAAFYIIQPDVTALAATVTVIPAKAGAEGIAGKTLPGTKITVTQTVCGNSRHTCREGVLTKVKAGPGGTFSIRTGTGKYTLTFHARHLKPLKVPVKVSRRHGVYIVTKVVHQGGHSLLSPVIFNY